MKLPAFRFLKTLGSHREITLKEANELLTKKFDDYRDWYPVATLIKQGYVNNPFTGDSGQRMTEREIASMLHAKTLGVGNHKINNVTAINRHDTQETFIFYLTSQADVYFVELFDKRVDKLISVLIGIFSAIATTYVLEWLKLTH